MSEDYEYLSSLSSRAQETIINRVRSGGINLYASIMSVLGYRKKNGLISELESEKEYYKSKNIDKVSDIAEDVFDEIFGYVYAKFLRNQLRRGGDPAASKDESLIAKGAMVLALKTCNVSDKNIVGMMGVMNQILSSTGKTEIKRAYQEYIKQHLG